MYQHTYGEIVVMHGLYCIPPGSGTFLVGEMFGKIHSNDYALIISKVTFSETCSGSKNFLLYNLLYIWHSHVHKHVYML